MPPIDERVVAMSFENAVFEQRAAQTMATLSKLDISIKNIGNVQGLDNIEKAASKVTLQGPMSALDKLRAKLGGAGQGAAEGFGDIDRAAGKVTLEAPAKALDKLQSKMGQLSAGTTFTDIERASDRVTFDGMSRAIEAMAGRFGMLQNVATVAFGNITAQAAMRGAAFAKSFAFGPIQQGLEEYQTNLQSIQTILANTADSGGNLKTVNAALDELNHYSDQTIYNFSEMAKNIGTFTAAGVQLKPATAAIKGIANLAALSGSNSQQASTAMYQLSQAIAAGKVGLQDWNSVVNAGMGGAVFQKALMRTAEQFGALEKGAVKIDKATGKATVNGQSFRESIMAKPGQQSWLTSDVLTKTLSQFTGDLSDAQLAAQGFNDEQIKSIQQTAKLAQHAATEVKTLPQVFDVAKETIGSGWSATFRTIFGDFEESKKTFTEMSNFINGWINRTSDARNKLLDDWKKLGGRGELLGGIKQAFADLFAVLAPIREAFRDIFPATTGRQLFEATQGFHAFFVAIKPSETVVENLRRTFAGLFAVVHIGWSILKTLVGVVFDLLGVVGKGSGGVLAFTGNIGDFLVAVDDALTKGDALKNIFSGIGAVLAVPLKLIVALARAIANLFTGTDPNSSKGFEDAVTGVYDKLGPLKKIVDLVVAAWDKLTDVLGKAQAMVSPWLDQMVDKFTEFADTLGEAFKNMDFEKVMSGLQTGFLAGIFLALKKGIGMNVSVLGDAFEGVNGLMSQFTKNLVAMQTNVHAQTLLLIAAAIGVLALGIKVLSTINGDDLARAMTATAIGLGELMGALKLMTMGVGKAGIITLPIIAAGLIGMATAVTILAGAMKIFSTFDWEGIAKGLAGVGGSIAAIGLSMKLMGGGPFLALQAAGLILMGVALATIAGAMKILADIPFVDLAKGVFAIAEALGAIALGVSMMPPTLPLTAAGLILMGIALSSIGSAIARLGGLDFGTILKGLGAMMAAIAGIGLAVSLVPPTIALTAAGLLIVGQAMVITAGAIALLGSLSLGTLVKGLVGMAGALIILAGGLTLMIATLPGSVALVAAAAALAVLAPTLGLLGTMKWSTIFKGLAAIGLTLLTVGAAGAIAAPMLAILGVALVPLGVGLLIVAKAAQLFAAALSVLSTEGQAGIAVLLAAVTGFVALLPTIAINFVKGLVDIIGQVAKILPSVITALGVVIDQIIAFVIASAPRLAVAIVALVTQFVNVLNQSTPQLIAVGFKLVGSFLQGVSQNIGPLTDKATEIVTKFLDALTRNASKLVDSGVRTLRAFLSGVSSRFGEIAASVGDLISRFISAVGSQAGKIAGAAAGMMGKFVAAIATFGPTLLTKGGEAILQFLEGLSKKGPEIIQRGVQVARKLLTGIGDGLVDLADIGFKAIIRFLNGLEAAIRENSDDLIDAGMGVGDAIMDGVAQAFGRGGGVVRKALEKVFELLPGWAKKVLGIKSPSRVFMDIGRFTMLGFQKGIEDNTPEVAKTAEHIGGSLVGAFRRVLGIRSPSEVMREIGMNVNRGFAQGLKGSADEVTNAFSSLNDQLRDKIRDLRTQVEEGNTKIEDLQQQHADKLAEIARLRSEKKPDADAIAAAVKEAGDLAKQIREESTAVSENERLLKTNRSARAQLVTGLKDEKNQLIGLKKGYEEISKQLDEATSKLNQAIEARDNKQKELTSQYAQAPDIDREAQDPVADFKKKLQERIDAVKKYAETLQKLRALGLDDATYNRLLAEGTQDQGFADQLLAQGQGGVDAINKLDVQLQAAAAKLGQDAAHNLYQAGVDAAQGIVDGLTAKKAELEKAMDVLADSIVRSIKAKLKIKSPSRILAEIGAYTVQGLADGLKQTRPVEDAAAQLGQTLTAAVSSAISDNIDANPTITPVLDLTQIQKGADQLSELTNVTPITAAASYGQASAASQEVSASQRQAAEAAAAAPTFMFEQNNYSPEALSDVEIYRQTRNQLGQVKSALGLAG